MEQIIDIFNQRTENFETKVIRTKTNMRATSLLAFSEILGKLGERENQVLHAIKSLGICNNLMISRYLHLPINCVTGRTNSLKKYRMIRVIKRDICPYTGKLTDFYKIPEWINEVLL